MVLQARSVASTTTTRWHYMKYQSTYKNSLQNLWESSPSYMCTPSLDHGRLRRRPGRPPRALGLTTLAIASLRHAPHVRSARAQVDRTPERVQVVSASQRRSARLVGGPKAWGPCGGGEARAASTQLSVYPAIMLLIPCHSPRHRKSCGRPIAPLLHRYPLAGSRRWLTRL